MFILAAYSSVEAPESIATIVVGILALLLPLLFKIKSFRDFLKLVKEFLTFADKKDKEKDKENGDKY